MNKRGQGLSTNAIILIVIGVIILVLLIVGFVMGWDKIIPWINPSNNVDDVKQACDIACSSGSSYKYCSQKRDLIAEGETIKDATCHWLSKNKPAYAISSCSNAGCVNWEPYSEQEQTEEVDEATLESKCQNQNKGDVIWYVRVNKEGDEKKTLMTFTCP